MLFQSGFRWDNERIMVMCDKNINKKNRLKVNFLYNVHVNVNKFSCELIRVISYEELVEP